MPTRRSAVQARVRQRTNWQPIKSLNRGIILDCIKGETEHRDILTRFTDIWQSRIDMMDILGEEAALDMLITNVEGQMGIHKTMRELLEQQGGRALVEKRLRDLKPGIKYSVRKEKFYRYAYNDDKVNAQKYHDKLSETECDFIEDARDIHSGGGDVKYLINHEIHGGEIDTSNGEEGFRRYCEEMTKANTLRRDIIELLTEK